MVVFVKIEKVIQENIKKPRKLRKLRNPKKLILRNQENIKKLKIKNI